MLLIIERALLIIERVLLIIERALLVIERALLVIERALLVIPYAITDNNIRTYLVDRIIKWLNNDVMDIENSQTGKNEFYVLPIPVGDTVIFCFPANISGNTVDKIRNLYACTMYSYNTSSLSPGVCIDKFTTRLSIIT
jgi:hypothetical protein